MAGYSLTTLLIIMVLMTMVLGEGTSSTGLTTGFLRYLQEEDDMEEACTSEQMEMCSTYANMTGSCSVFGKGTEGAWCGYGETKICCSEDLDDCCEGDAKRLRIIIGFVLACVAFIVAFSCAACECCPLYGCRPKPTKKYSDY